MGLDMYLEAKKYISFFPGDTPDPDALAFHAILSAANLPNLIPPTDIHSLTISVRVGYWRKANQIHAWFVKNVQESELGVDELGVEKLQELRKVCKQALDRHTTEAALELLPPQSGFFFGDTEVNDYYWQDLEDTVAIIDRILSSDELKSCYFTYRASW